MHQEKIFLLTIAIFTIIIYLISKDDDNTPNSSGHTF